MCVCVCLGGKVEESLPAASQPLQVFGSTSSGSFSVFLIVILVVKKKKVAASYSKWRMKALLL